MSDDLEQLLRRADADAPAPTIEVDDLPKRIRHTARTQRRIAACGFAILAVLVIASALVFPPLRLGEGRGEGPKKSSATLPPNASSPQPFHLAISANDVGGREGNTVDLAHEITLHSRTAQLLESWERRPASKIDPTDAFLVNLAAQRNQTALLLLYNADHLLDSDNRVAAVATLRKTIALFPETPAASRANKQLEQLELRSQS